MTTKIFILLLFVLGNLLYSQQANSIVLPSPKIGWDSLQAKIIYPEIGRRARIWCAYEVSLTVDSIGNTSRIHIECANYSHALNSTDSIFIIPIIKCFSSIEWNPGKVDNKSKEMDVVIPLIYYLTDRRNVPQTIFIKAISSYPMLYKSGN